MRGFYYFFRIILCASCEIDTMLCRIIEFTVLLCYHAIVAFYCVGTSAMSILTQLQNLSPSQRQELVQRVAQKVREQMNRELVTPSPEIRGTWQDLGDLRNNPVEQVVSTPRTAQQIAKMIDHTLLKPTATRTEIITLCEEARQYGFASVCVNSAWVGVASKELSGCPSMAIAVVGFPLGAMATSSKADETRQAIKDGAEEIDMVLNIGALKGGDFDLVYDDIRAVVDAAQGRPVKVILETSMLNKDEKIAGCTISKAAGAHFVKTSTGFGGGGATVDDIKLMRAIVGPNIGVKASGGIRSLEDVQNMIQAGANRIGASSGVAIIKGQMAKGGY